MNCTGRTALVSVSQLAWQDDSQQHHNANKIEHFTWLAKLTASIIYQIFV